MLCHAMIGSEKIKVEEMFDFFITKSVTQFNPIYRSEKKDEHTAVTYLNNTMMSSFVI